MRQIELELDMSHNYFIREAFNTLRTNILFSGKQVKTILLTSCFAHEGKTTVSMELSRRLAENDKKVLLIDADLRKSVTASRYAKQRGIVGLSQILSGQVELVNGIYRTQVPGLDMIFAGPFPPNPAELVGSASFKEMLAAVREVYDYVIIDAPPLGLVIDAAVMAGFCDGAVLVINQSAVKYRVAQDVKMQLSKSGCRILGVVMNQAQRQKKNVRGRRSEQYYSRYEYYGHKNESENSVQSPVKPPVAGQRPASAPVRRPAPMGTGEAPVRRPMPGSPSARPATQQRPVPPKPTDNK
jgi:capsular exopolysaccharide synthesis family protein